MSKQYDVYGIGNAIVDMEFEVNDAFFHEHGIEKGMMTLVDEDRQHVLVNAIRSKEVKQQSGGSAANSIIAVNQFGGKAYYSCKVAKDDFGHFYMKDLQEAGVDTNLEPENLPEGITGKCLVMITADAERTMNTFLGITSDLSEKELKEEAIKNSQYIYIEGFLIPSETGRKAMLEAKKVAKKHGVRTALTFSDPSMVKYFREGLQEVVGEDGVDLLFCNEEEAMLYTGKDNVEGAKEELKKAARTFVITKGNKGALVYDGKEFINIAPNQVKAVDSTGAGDMFAGAFMFGLTHGYSFAEAGKLASLASSKVVAKYGPRLDAQQVKAILSQLQEA